MGALSRSTRATPSHATSPVNAENALFHTVAAILVPNLVAWLLVLLAALWTSGPPWRRATGIGVALCAFLPPWFLPENEPLVRGVSALIAVIGAMRVLDLRRGAWRVRERLTHVISVVDTRRLVRVPSRADARAVATGLVWLGLALVGYSFLRARPPAAPVAFWAARWGCALVVVYAGVSAGYSFAHTGYALLGFETGALHISPALARSVQELWGERWARPISIWLLETFFRPCARRRRPQTGAVLAFAVSAAFHAYAIWVALGLVRGLTMTGSMLAYFLVQALVIALERSVGVKRWPPWAGHAWTVSWMLATAPLFLEPSVRVLGVAAP
jgi:hypothetical protein